jgi:hypothetical protein
MDTRNKPKQMTQKVYEVALLSGGSFFPDTNTALLQKFAENIVEECARIAETEPNSPYINYGDKIRAHFGLKDFV